MIHPIQRMIEKMHKEGACPRLSVDLTSEGVSCPDFVTEQWKEGLIVDLDPSWPLNLSFEADAIEVDLAFSGYVERCTLPYKAIYVVVNRATGEGVVLEENMPESVRLKRDLHNQSDGKSNAGESRRHKRPTEPAPKFQPLAAVSMTSEAEPEEESNDAAASESVASESVASESAASESVASESVDSEATSSKSRDEVAQRRRSAFRVIDGG